MPTRLTGPVVCFSYLASAELWKVESFPAANYGAEVLNIEQSIAADAPMVAAVLAALGRRVLLLSNDLGTDPAGRAVQQWLRRFRVSATARQVRGIATPRIVVISDQQGARTWFPHLPGVAGGLAAADLSAVTGASYAYIDCYELIAREAARAIGAARAAAVPTLLNLGGSPLEPGICAAARAHPALCVQTNVDDDAWAQATDVARSILLATDAAWVVVTAGASGAVAVSTSRAIAVPAFRVSVRQTHCAGAAFSGALLYGLLHGWLMKDSLTLASASAAVRCESAHHQPLPTLDQLTTFIATRETLERVRSGQTRS